MYSETAKRKNDVYLNFWHPIERGKKREKGNGRVENRKVTVKWLWFVRTKNNSLFLSNFLRCSTCFFLKSTNFQLFSISCICYGIWLLARRSQYAELVSPSLYVDVGRILVVISILSLANYLICFYAIFKEMRCIVTSVSFLNFSSVSSLLKLLLKLCSF